MINSNLTNNGLGNSHTSLPVHKQSPIAMKKMALRDVQNDNRSFIRNHTESSCVPGGPTADTIKVSGTKRLTPECPSNPPYHQSLRSNGANEHHILAGRKFLSELGKRRAQEISDTNTDSLNLRQYSQKQSELPQQQPDNQEQNTSFVSAFAPFPTASRMSFSPGRPSDPFFLGKPGHCLPAAESNHLRFNSKSEVHYLADSKGTNDTKERFLRLQKLLKHCDDSGQRDYIQMLRQLSPLELSRHAVELERRSIQLSVEEGKEIERMKALNIFGKSSMSNNPSPTFQQVWSKK